MGAGGFIGNAMVKRLKSDGYFVRGLDLKYPEFGITEADEFVICDLRDKVQVKRNIVDKYQKPFYPSKTFDEVYQFAADMGGAAYVFTGEHDADIMSNSAQINLNVLECLIEYEFKGKIFYSSSACIYPAHIQEEENNPGLKETDCYPAGPDSDYGWEKLFSERLYMAYSRNYGMDIRIARFHNIYGPEGTYEGGKEKAPAAICRKVARADMPSIEIWGDGEQTRSFLYIDDCIDAVRLLMASNFKEPINIGSEEMVSINQLAELVIGIAKKEISIYHIDGPVGVRGRNSNNDLIRNVLGWEPKYSLKQGLEKTYAWIAARVSQK